MLYSSGELSHFGLQAPRKQIDAKFPLLKRGVQRYILLLRNFNAGAEDGNGCLSSFKVSVCFGVGGNCAPSSLLPSVSVSLCEVLLQHAKA